MKRILSLTMALALAASQAFSYTVEDLKKVEAGSAALTTADAVLHAMLPGDLSAELALVGDLSKEINNLVAYAIEDQSFQVRIARVINRVATDASWQKAAAIDGAFLKNFSVQLTHGIASEVVSYFRGKTVDAAIKNVSDSRVVGRAAQALATAITTSLLETTFHHIDKALALPGANANKRCMDVVVGTFMTSLVTEIAYNLAGEAILCGASNARADMLNDILYAK